MECEGSGVCSTGECLNLADVGCVCVSGKCKKAVFWKPLQQDGGECVGSGDCMVEGQKCYMMADVGCKCVFGKCRTDGNPFVQHDECDTFKDCECKSNPKKCFCHDRQCVTEAWECHKAYFHIFIIFMFYYFYIKKNNIQICSYFDIQISIV